MDLKKTRVLKLIHNFENLSDSEKRSFLKGIMPSVHELFRQDPQLMMRDIMPACKEMLEGCIDAREMVTVMEAMHINHYRK